MYKKWGGAGPARAVLARDPMPRQCLGLEGGDPGAAQQSYRQAWGKLQGVKVDGNLVYKLTQVKPYKSEPDWGCEPE